MSAKNSTHQILLLTTMAECYGGRMRPCKKIFFYVVPTTKYVMFLVKSFPQYTMPFPQGSYLVPWIYMLFTQDTMSFPRDNMWYPQGSYLHVVPSINYSVDMKIPTLWHLY